MTVAELKAYMEGLEVVLEGTSPTPRQWEAIKEKISQLRQSTITTHYEPIRLNNTTAFCLNVQESQ